MVIRMAEQPGGPGQFARRTDRQPVRQVTDAAYGEQKTFREQQQAAPMVNTNLPADGAPVAVDPAAGVTPFGAPSERPDEPVTAGAPFGPGPGPDPSLTDIPGADAKRLAKYLPAIMQQAARPDSGEQIKLLAQYLRGVVHGA